MVSLEQIGRVHQLHKLIVCEKTDPLCELANRFHVSKRQLYNVLGEFRDLGAEIAYSRVRQTFYYSNNFDIEISFKVSHLNSSAQKNVSGGEKLFSAILFH
ncbi:MAG: hypothetical protein H6Q13_2377 [Bacteroidetes bacterium]|nr:hypothetical protein [Bacteroidota bacterium]